MKCSICGNELSELGHCPACGQLNRPQESCESVSRHWQAVQTETTRYESKLDQAVSQVRSQYRAIRKKRRIRLAVIAVVIAAAVYFLGGEFLENGVQYLSARQAMDHGEYARATQLFETLPMDFLDAGDLYRECREKARPEYYQTGMDEYEAEEYRTALELFDLAQDYSDAPSYARRCMTEILNQMPPVAYHWSFDEDLSEENGAVTEQRGDAVAKNVVDSRIGGALILDGDGDYVTGGAGANVTERWALSTLLLPQSWDDMAVLAKMDWKTGDYAYRMYIQDCQLVWKLTLENGEVAELISQTSFFPGEQWHLVTVVRDSSELMLYVDGQKEASVILSANPAQGEQILTIGDQTFREEGCTLTGFQGCIADVAIYEVLPDELERQLMYRIREYDCTHPWDTSFYPLPEEALREHFVIYRSTGEQERTEILVFDLSENWGECINWYGESMSFCYADDSLIRNAARYYAEGESWEYLDSGMTETWTSAADVISSTLAVYRDDGHILEPLVIGGTD